MESKKPDVSYKVLVVGSYGVGKTSLLRRLSGQDMSTKVITTVASDFTKVHFGVASALVELCLWDTPGQERFSSVTKQQLSGINGVVLVYSIDDAESFKHMDYWIDSLLNGDQIYGSSDCQLPMIMIGNKSDLEADRQVDKLLAEKLSYSNFMVGFEELSALYGEGVKEIFQRFASFIADSLHPKLVLSISSLSLKSQGGDTEHNQTSEDNKTSEDNQTSEDDTNQKTCCTCNIL